MNNNNNFNALYQELEPAIMPIVRSMAERFHRSLGISVEDAVQEARLELVTALRSYDYNRSRGGVYSYARRSVERAMLGLLYSATSRGRMPYIPVIDDVTGEVRLVRRWPTLLEPGVMENMAEMDDFTPERAAEEAEMMGRLQVLKMRLVNSLTDREQAIFSCLAHPSDEFGTFLRNIGVPASEDPTNVHIARFLGVTKNAVDWSIHKIKRQFTRLAEAEFSDVIQSALEEGRWPMLYISHNENDTDFIRRIIEERGLDPRPISQRDVASHGQATRVFEPYAWGSVIFLRLGSNVATVVVQGRFNAITGEVIGDGGYWKSLVEELDWYRDLNRALKRADA